MYAIIEDSGTQIRVAKGDVLDIDLRDVGPRSKKIKFDRVLLVGETGVTPTIGRPYVSGAAVTAEILEEVKADKIDVIKYKRRKGYRRKMGHTQRFLRIRIEKITGPAASKPKPRTKKTTAKSSGGE
ncbi:MAG: 50S ribosomal protein L21 [Planctomycetes bacterium]|nr:50S ribosomal protein L21 [Planctomycetota bacterium]